MLTGAIFWLVIFSIGLLVGLLGHYYVTQMVNIPRLSAANNLPYVRGPFVGRDSELQEISHMLMHSSYSGVAAVNIYGAPAVGKSTLAVQLGHQLTSYGISVGYINVHEARHLFKYGHTNTSADKSSAASDCHSTNTMDNAGSGVAIPWYSDTDQKYVLISSKMLVNWAKSLKRNTLLILDNSDDLLQRGKTLKDDFKEILRTLLEVSNHLKLVVTSRAQLLMRVGGFHPFPLKELDPSSAVQLLQLQSKLISTEESKVIAELVGYNPLGLAELVSASIDPPHVIIDGLRENLLLTLNKYQSQRIQEAFQLSYDYLDGRIQLCNRYLSHFPGSFNRHAAMHILSRCNFSDSEQLLCLQTVVEVSLLEVYWRADQPRYRFQRLVREFLRSVQTDGHIKTEFESHYQAYYSQTIASLSLQYSIYPYSSEVISSLECDIHNFLNLITEMVELRLHTKSALNIAYGFSNSTDFFIRLFGDCKYCFVELLEALVLLFDEQMLQISHRIGKKETALLYFNLISGVKRWLISNRNLWIDHTMPCCTVCRGAFVNHPSRVEKLLAVSNTLDAYYYHPLTCYLDCFPGLLSTALGVAGVLITLLVNQNVLNKKAPIYKFVFLLLLFQSVVIFGFSISHARTLIMPLTVLTLINYVYFIYRSYKQGQYVQMLFTVVGASLLLIGITCTMPWHIFTSSVQFYVYRYYGLIIMLLIILFLWSLQFLYVLLYKCYCVIVSVCGVTVYT